MVGDRYSGPSEGRGHLGNKRALGSLTWAFLEAKGRTGDWIEVGSSQWVGVFLGCCHLWVWVVLH